MKMISSLRASVYENIEEWFSGGSHILANAYHVYGEADLRNEDLVPVRPFLFVLDYGVQYDYRHLPVLLVQIETHQRPAELGSRHTYFNQMALHVVGHNRGERDDIASAIMENVTDISLYNFNTAGSTIYSTTAALEANREGDYWVALETRPSPEEIKAGVLTNWLALVTSFWAFGNDLSS